MATRHLLEKQNRERLRGWIIYLLYLQKPSPFDLNALWLTLDQYNQPVAHHRFVEEVDYLRSLGVLRIFPAGSKTELDSTAQALLLQRYLETPRASDIGFVYGRLTPAGVQFQEHNAEVIGIERVE